MHKLNFNLPFVLYSRTIIRSVRRQIIPANIATVARVSMLAMLHAAIIT
jgi:hypothetical protein